LNSQWAQLDEAIKDKYERRADYSRRTESRLTLLAKRKKCSGANESKVPAYSIFVRQKHEQFKQSNPEMTVSDRSRAISELWEHLSNSDKIPFINAAKRETRKMRRISDEEDVPDDLDSE
jgi:hypothetical protein